MKIHKTCYTVYADGHEEVLSEFIYSTDAWRDDDRLKREFEVNWATRITVERGTLSKNPIVVGTKVVYEVADESEECRTIVRPQLTMTFLRGIDTNTN